MDKVWRIHVKSSKIPLKLSSNIIFEFPNEEDFVLWKLIPKSLPLSISSIFPLAPSNMKCLLLSLLDYIREILVHYSLNFYNAIIYIFFFPINIKQSLIYL